MTDTNQSGAPAAPAADGPAPAAPAETPAGSFGSTRGSGLSRGRRPQSATAPAATPAKSDYKPTAVEVITHEREYRNPFAGPEAASAPAAEPANVEKAAAPPAAESQPKAADMTAAPADAAEPTEQKPEIQILPPAEASRPAVRWESASASAPRADSRPERPDFGGRPPYRSERRDDRGEPRAEGRDFRRNQPPREARPQADQRPRPEPTFPDRGPQEPKPAAGGFLGWLKRLFGGGKPAEAPAVREGVGGEPYHDGQRHRRRHRGGRGHGGDYQGFRGDRPQQGGERDPRGGDQQGGRRRRRHRGGYGRGRGGDPRSEGHQGGGAI